MRSSSASTGSAATRGRATTSRPSVEALRRAAIRCARAGDSASAARPSSGASIHIHDVQADPEYHLRTRSDRIRSGPSWPSRCCASGEPLGVDRRLPLRGPAVHRRPDRAARDLRRPGRDRHRERAAVQRAAGADGELTRSVEELRRSARSASAVSSTLDLETVLNTIVSRAIQLAGTDACTIYEYDEQTRGAASSAPPTISTRRWSRCCGAPRSGGARAWRAHGGDARAGPVPDIAEPGAYERPAARRPAAHGQPGAPACRSCARTS